MIEIRNLTKSYGEKVAVDDLSFTVQSGTITGAPRRQVAVERRMSRGSPQIARSP